MIIRKAKIEDLNKIKEFTDFWLAGRGLPSKAPGAVNDYFISPSQHKKYIEKYSTFIVTTNNSIIAWAVTQKNSSLIHFLVSGYHRHQGIGKTFLTFISPQTIHSKSNQSSGNPGPFYEHMGYKKIRSVKSKSRYDIDILRPDRKKIIDIYKKNPRSVL